jgi:hypothetical protein
VEDAAVLELQDALEEVDCVVASLLRILVLSALALVVDEDVADRMGDDIV